MKHTVAFIVVSLVLASSTPPRVVAFQRIAPIPVTIPFELATHHIIAFGDPFDRAFSGLSLRAEGPDDRTFRVRDVLEQLPASDGPPPGFTRAITFS